jgi:hypothetical protein
LGWILLLLHEGQHVGNALFACLPFVFLVFVKVIVVLGQSDATLRKLSDGMFAVKNNTQILVEYRSNISKKKGILKIKKPNTHSAMQPVGYVLKIKSLGAMQPVGYH